jgi:hypothetical protein
MQTLPSGAFGRRRPIIPSRHPCFSRDRMPAKADFQPVFTALRSILAEFEPRLAVVHDEPDHYYLNTNVLGPNKRPLMFGAVRIGKGYVSYHLMCVYTGHNPGMSPALKKRMQGKACFNFKSVDDDLFAELRVVTKRGYEAWRKLKWVE